MDCPNCGARNLLSTETFKTATITYRTKKCRECKWTFTSHETIVEQLEIPTWVRQIKRLGRDEAEKLRKDKDERTDNSQKGTPAK